MQGPALRELVETLRQQRADARAIGVATPRQFREDVIALLHSLDTEARTGRLPPYLPRDADVTTLAIPVRVRRGVRTGLRTERAGRRDSHAGLRATGRAGGRQRTS